jgi:hypothetical protein
MQSVDLALASIETPKWRPMRKVLGSSRHGLRYRCGRSLSLVKSPPGSVSQRTGQRVSLRSTSAIMLASSVLISLISANSTR